jgi:SAM-dependent methyltransferase
MKILAAIANFGTGNRQYLEALLREYRSMQHAVDVVVLSNIPKDLGVDVEVIVGLPTSDPWSLPFGHKKLFADRADEYDLFIYSEDDTLISQRNIDAFIAATAVMNDDELAGFMRYEVGPDGKRHFPEVHGHFHWRCDSLRTRGPFTMAHFTCDHAACYMLTRQQLKRAIASGGFFVPPHQHRYDLLVTAATDPYTQCGFRKYIPVSHFDDFLIPHLPNKYVGRIGLEQGEVRRQIDALLALAQREQPVQPLVEAETHMPRARWSKSYYDDLPVEADSAIPASARSVLSIGCASGIAERAIIQRGVRVVGVPLDPVIGPCAQARGVEIFDKDRHGNEHFDCLLFADVLHLAADPAAFLASYSVRLSPNGVIVATLPNMGQLPVRWRRMRGQDGYDALENFDKGRTQLTNASTIRLWFKQSGLVVDSMIPLAPPRWPSLARLPAKLAKGLWADQFVVVARSSGSARPAVCADAAPVGGLAH